MKYFACNKSIKKYNKYEECSNKYCNECIIYCNAKYCYNYVCNKCIKYCEGCENYCCTPCSDHIFELCNTCDIYSCGDCFNDNLCYNCCKNISIIENPQAAD